MIFLGMSDTTPAELLHKIRQMDTENDWTHKRTDEQLLNNCTQIVNESVKLKQDCQKYGFYYYDTSSDRTETLNKIVDIVRKENKQ